MRCVACGFDSPVGFRFCGGCGAGLPAARDDGPPPAEAGGPAPAQRPDAEHRQLTVLFCDLVGSTALSRRLHAEDYAEVLRAYLEQCDEVVRRHGGRIARVVGDGLLVYFGYPAAHEDDAERAVLAGTGLVEAVRRLRPEVRGAGEVQLAVRIGIHTGLAVVGEMGRGDTWDPMASVGETPNVAARIQEWADPHMVLVSTATRQLLRDRVPTRAVGTRPLKGLPEPIALYQVVAGPMVDRRVESRASVRSIVDREEELGLLLDRWARSCQGRGQIVLLAGEAGIGKSRLVQALKDHVASGPHHRWESRCSPHFQHSAFHPFIEMVEQALELRRDDPKENLRKLERAIAPHGPPERLVPLFATFLAIPLAERYAPLPMSLERQRREVMQEAVSLMLAISMRQPLLLIVEDLHWVDPSTLELLTMLIERVPEELILAVFTYRPDFDPPWRGGQHLERLTLKGFPPGPVAAMATSVAAGKRLPEQVIAQVVARTDGVPLFIEELTRMLIDSGGLTERDDRYELRDPSAALEIPSTLRDLLSARLDSLSAAKPVAQLAAVIGREFSYRLLAAVSPLDDMELQASLDGLVESGLLYQSGSPPESVYRFKHHLIQEAAYDSLLRRRRRDFHHRIASVLDERFPDLADTRPELLAHHYTAAEVYDAAVGYWQRAGEQALERSAATEAAVHLRQGLALTAYLPQGAARAEAEVMLQIRLGAALTATQGYGAEEVAKTYARARDLCEELGETAQLFPALRGLQSFYMVHGPLESPGGSANSSCARPTAARTPSGWWKPSGVSGGVCSASARRRRSHASPGSNRPVRSRPVARAHRSLRSDPAVVARVNLGWLEWFAGWPERAVERSRAAVSLARELRHPLSLAYALCMSAAVHQCRREARATRALAGETVVLAEENGFLTGRRGGSFSRVGRSPTRASATRSRALARGTRRLSRNGRRAFPSRMRSPLRPRSAPRSDELATRWRSSRKRVMPSRRTTFISSRPTSCVAGARCCGCSAMAEQKGYFRDSLEVAREQGALSLELSAAVHLAELGGRRAADGEARTRRSVRSLLEGFETAGLRELARCSNAVREPSGPSRSAS